MTLIVRVLLTAIIFVYFPLPGLFFFDRELGIETNPVYRSYSFVVTSEEKKAIHYIITSLADKSLFTLYQEKTDLEKAGERVDHVHPLQFLCCVFSDEEMKVAMRNIKKRGGWVWSSFFDGLKGSLTEEDERGNLLDEFVVDFCNRLEIDATLIFPIIREREWKLFLEQLILLIPRKGDFNRYDM